MDTINSLVEFLLPYQEYSYFLVFGILIGCGFGLPIPEDVVLVTGGILSGLGAESTHLNELLYMLSVSMIGVLLGDSIMYILGRTLGYRIQKFKPMRMILPPKRFAQVQKLFNKYGIWVLFVARFLPVLRSPTFLAAGMSRRVGFIKFILMDGFAALISVPIWVLIGHYGAQNRENLANWLKDSKIALLVFTVSIVTILGLYIYKKVKQERIKKDEKLAESQKKLASQNDDNKQV